MGKAPVLIKINSNTDRFLLLQSFPVCRGIFPRHILKEAAESCLLYTSFASSVPGLSGNVGPSGGVQDLQGPDQGSLCFLRGLLSLELYPTDEALWNWKDEGIVELCTNNWDYTLFYAYTFYQMCIRDRFQ